MQISLAGVKNDIIGKGVKLLCVSLPANCKTPPLKRIPVAHSREYMIDR